MFSIMACASPPEPNSALHVCGKSSSKSIRDWPLSPLKPPGAGWSIIPSVGRLPDRANFYYAIGFSGHGVNLTSVFGRILADLIRGKAREWTWLPYLDRLPLYTPNEPFRWTAIKLATEYYHLPDPKTP
jgi:hypothetical protein